MLLITSVIYNATNDQLTLTWDSSPDALYTIEYTEALEHPAVWDTVTTDIVSQGSTTTQVIDGPLPGTYYRIKKQ